MAFKLLIIDDEELIIDGLKEILPWDEMGIVLTRTAANGIEAIEIVNKEKPDIIMTDIKMPLMDGLQLAEYLCKNEVKSKTVICTGYADFDYAKKAIEYQVKSFLMKPVDPKELYDVITNIVNQLELEKNQLKTLNLYEEKVRNDQLSAHYLSETRNRDALNLQTTNKLIMCVINMSNYDICTFQILQQYFDEISKKYGTLCEHSIFFQNSFSDNQFILITEHNKAVKDAIIYQTMYDLLKEYSEYIRAKMGIHTMAGISTVYKNKNESFQIYLKTKFITENMQSKPNRSIYFEHQFNKAFESLKVNTNIINNLMLQMEFGNRKQVFSLYQDMIKQWAMNENALIFIKMNIQQVLISMSNLFVRYNGNLYELGHNYADIFSEIWKIQKIEDLVNLSSILLEAGYDYLNCIRDKKETLISQVIQYIKEYYAQPITLSSVASRFYISPSYLSRKFKNEQGVNFNDYINHIRLSKAQYLLETTEFKIADIAKIVGYDNEYYFSKKFTGTFGKSPSLYRKNRNLPN